MRKFLLYLLFLVPLNAFTQVVDDFSDGDFTNNPTWTGDVNDWRVNEAFQLQSVLSATGKTIRLVTPSNFAGNSIWEFYIKLNFDPSAANQLRIYLMSDNEDLNASLNGYFVQIGEAGNTDSYNLFRQSGTTVTRIIDGPQKVRPNVNVAEARIRVTRDSNGNWELLTDINGGRNFISEGLINDNSIQTSSFFGLRATYTATRSDQFFFDDLSINVLVEDTTPPTITSTTAINATTVQVQFNEPIRQTEAENTGNYTINKGIGIPSMAVLDQASKSRVTLTLANALQADSYTITINNIKDISGNAINPNSTSNFSFVPPFVAKFGDVRITEIFADPTPRVDLPEVEFLEIYNHTNVPINLGGWKYSDPTAVYTFPANTIINPSEYIILCPANAVDQFSSFGRTLGISPFPTLNNAGDNLRLVDQNNVLIDAVNYTDAWYKDNVKRNGGWSLELIDLNSVCSGISNWIASKDPSGGTPGRQNSVFDLNANSGPLQVFNAAVTSNRTLEITYNKTIDSTNAVQTNKYVVNNNFGSPISVTAIAPDFTKVVLTFANDFVRGVNYTVTVSNVSDCAGQNIGNQNSAAFLQAQILAAGDILISEILFNPPTGGVDFVEIYNNSNKILDLRDLQIGRIANINQSSTIEQIRTITNTPRFMQPGEYIVISGNPDLVKQFYTTTNPNGFIQVIGTFPGFNNDQGTAVLLSGSAVIDQFSYTDKMHLALLRDVKGVSLERSSFKRGANEPGNFRSAASTVGFATPGYKNSQFLEDVELGSEVTLPVQVFSPNNDGVDDVLQINYKFDQPDLIANVTILNDRGIVVKRLLRNQPIGLEGTLIWDGTTDTNSAALTGIHFIYFEIFGLDGTVKKFRKTCVVAAGNF